MNLPSHTYWWSCLWFSFFQSVIVGLDIIVLVAVCIIFSYILGLAFSLVWKASSLLCWNTYPDFYADSFLHISVSLGRDSSGWEIQNSCRDSTEQFVSDISLFLKMISPSYPKVFFLITLTYIKYSWCVLNLEPQQGISYMISWKTVTKEILRTVLSLFFLFSHVHCIQGPHPSP